MLPGERQRRAPSTWLSEWLGSELGRHGASVRAGDGWRTLVLGLQRQLALYSYSSILTIRNMYVSISGDPGPHTRFV